MARQSRYHRASTVFPAMLLALLFAACSNLLNNNSENGTQTSTDTPPVSGTSLGELFWGSWVRMDGANIQWYLASDGVAIGGATKVSVSSPTDAGFALAGITVTKVTDNILKVEPSGSLAYYLFRESGASSKASLGVSALGTAKGLSGLGGINMIIKNAQNPGNSQTVQTSADGGASLTGLIMGDTYSVTVPAQTGVTTTVSTTVTPVFDGENLGFITVGQAQQNFKVSYVITGNPDYLYRGQNYTLNIKITNIGSQDMLSADYEVKQPMGLTLSGSLADILGTVKANGGERSVSLTMNASDNFASTERVFEIPVRISSINGSSVWTDSVSLRFFREPMTIYILSATSLIQGILISPDRSSTPITMSDSMIVNTVYATLSARTTSISRPGDPHGSITVPVRNKPYGRLLKLPIKYLI